MKRHHCASLSALTLLLVILTQTTETSALVVSAPGIPIDSFVDTAPPVDATVTPPVVLRIRSTNEDDLHDISSLLASASVTTDESQWNWKTSMQVLRSKSAFYNLLSSRYEVMREGERAAKRVPLDDAINDADRMRLLWAHDSFRQKLEKAASMAKEPHVWMSKDFAVCPQDSNVLHHAMLTAEDVATGNVVGFCEVAMLSLPSCQQDECATVACAPTIANLATSRKHRRQGIASSLLKSAKQYVQRKWDREDLSLYVESANKGAIALYSKHGFLTHGSESSREDANGEIYMTTAPQMETVGV